MEADNRNTNPFSKSYNAEESWELVQQAQEGSQQALEKLVKLHQRFIYNVALRFVRDSDEAADLSQEVLIKMVTKLNQFEGKSDFRTWLYGIVFTHFLKTRKRKAEAEINSFAQYGKFLEDVHGVDDFTNEEQIKHQDKIDYVRNRCMTSMLLCLDRQQRLIFIIGAIFDIRSSIAGPLLEITPENFRQQLSRAKADVFQFMDNKCGLIKAGNSCRCSKKTKGFLQQGLLDENALVFKPDVVEDIVEHAPENNSKLDQLMDGKYQSFFRKQPYEDKEVVKRLISSLLLDKDIKDLFRLN